MRPRGQATRGRIRSLFRPSALSIRLRLIACFVLIVLLMIAADAVAVWQYWQIEAAAQRVSKIDQISLAVVRIHLDVYSFRDRMAALASSHDTRQFSARSGHDPTVISGAGRSYRADAQGNTLTLSKTHTSPTHSKACEGHCFRNSTQRSNWRPRVNGTRFSSGRQFEIPALIEFSSSLVERVDQQALEKRSEAIEDAQKARQRLFIIVPIAALLTLLAAAALGWYLTRTVTSPLSVLTASAEALARGDFQHRVHLHGNNELAVLGNAFNYAAQQLQKLYEDLRRSERELRGVINTVPAHVWSASPDGTVDFVNERLLEFVGLPSDDLIGMELGIRTSSR